MDPDPSAPFSRTSHDIERGKDGGALAKAFKGAAAKLKDDTAPSHANPATDRPDAPWNDPRVKRGMQAQLARRAERIAAGEKPLGWKLGFGAPATLEKLGISGPLVGYLMQGALLKDGAQLNMKNWTQAVAEPEIAAQLAGDLRRDRARRTPRGHRVANAGDRTARPRSAADFRTISMPCWVAPSISATWCSAPAAAKAVRPPTCPPASSAAAASQLRAADPEALTGKVPNLLVHLANMLAAFGERLKAGDLVICGSTVPPPLIEPDETDFGYELRPIGAVSVQFHRN